MDAKITYIIKTVTIIEFILVLFIIVIFYLFRFILKFRMKYHDKQIAKLRKELSAALEDKSKSKLPKKLVYYLRKHAFQLYFLILEIEHQKSQFTNWSEVISQLSNEIFKPKARKYYKSKRWIKRYLAVLYFLYGFDDIKDKECIIKLLDDDRLLVSINAAKIIAKCPNAELVDNLICKFSKERRLCQSACAEIITDGSKELSYMIWDALDKSKDIYQSMFCYRLLQRLPAILKIHPRVDSDIHSSNVDLKIAVLNYLESLNTKRAYNIIIEYIHDPIWEVRAVVAKIISSYNDDSVIPLLKSSLKDPEWWVRVNAANALLFHGESGVAALKEESICNDKFARETAQSVLKVHEKND